MRWSALKTTLRSIKEGEVEEIKRRKAENVIPSSVSPEAPSGTGSPSAGSSPHAPTPPGPQPPLEPRLGSESSPGSALRAPPAPPPLPAHPLRSACPPSLSPSLRTGGQQRWAGRRCRRLADGDEGHVEAEVGGGGGEEQVGAGASPGLPRRHRRSPATSPPRPLPPSPKMAAAAARSREGREAGPAAIPAGRGGGGRRGGGGSGGGPRAGLASGTRRPQGAGSPAMPCVGDWLNSPLSIVQGIFGEAGPRPCAAAGAPWGRPEPDGAFPRGVVVAGERRGRLCVLDICLISHISCVQRVFRLFCVSPGSGNNACCLLALPSGAAVACAVSRGCFRAGLDLN